METGLLDASRYCWRQTNLLISARPQRQTNAEGCRIFGDLDQLKLKDTIQKTVDWSPRRREERKWNNREINRSTIYLPFCIFVLLLISRFFYFLSSLRRGDQSTVFCIVTVEDSCIAEGHPGAPGCKGCKFHLRTTRKPLLKPRRKKTKCLWQKCLKREKDWKIRNKKETANKQTIERVK